VRDPDRRVIDDIKLTARLLVAAGTMPVVYTMDHAGRSVW
jgi:hypothetical protein